MEFIKAIIKPSYWFTQQHPVPEQWQIALTAFFSIILFFGLVTAIMSFKKRLRKPYRTMYAKYSTWAWTMGLLGYLMLFFSVQQIAYVSSRFFYLLWLALAIWWLYYCIRYMVKDVPRLVKGQKEKERMEKYLPRKK